MDGWLFGVKFFLGWMLKLYLMMDGGFLILIVSFVVYCFLFRGILMVICRLEVVLLNGIVLK